MNCSECQELLAEYALEALDADQERQVREHLETGCLACSRELALLEATLAKLPLALNPVVPSDEVRDRLMSRIRRSNRGPLMGAPTGATPSQPIRRWVESLIAVAAVLVVIFLWLKLDRQQQELLTLQETVSRQTARVDQLQTALDREGSDIRLFASPAVQLVALQGAQQPQARGRVFWDKNSDSFHVYVTGMKPLAPQKTYELWFINSQEKKIPAGTFEANGHGEASLVAKPPADAGAVVALAVTDEPITGSPQPTGQIQLIGKMQ